MGSAGLGSFGAIRQAVPADAVRMPAAASSLPSESYVTITDVRGQSPKNACTGFAFSDALNMLHGGGLVLSPGAVYFNNRMASNPAWRNVDAGAYMQPSAEALKQQGAGSEILHPYHLDISVEPSLEYQAQALDHRVMEYYRTLTVQQYRTAIANGLPVILSFDVPPGFREVGETGEWVDRGGPALGGHAVVGVGYRDAKQKALIKNSWDDDWGIAHPEAPDEGDGYFWVPYSVLEGPRWWDGFVITTWDLEAGR